jgi:hypothetical protein
MVDITITGDRIHLNVEGWDKLWALRSELEFPTAHITSVYQDADAARGWWKGFRMPGTQIPGVITAGTFYQTGGVVFYDVHDPDRTIVLELDHEHYDKLVIEVADPESAVAQIRAALTGRP